MHAAADAADAAAALPRVLLQQAGVEAAPPFMGLCVTARSSAPYAREAAPICDRHAAKFCRHLSRRLSHAIVSCERWSTPSNIDSRSRYGKYSSSLWALRTTASHCA